MTSEAAGWGRGLLDPSAVRLAPRLGFALALNDSRAVIRGGYGIFLNQWAYSVQTAFARNLPFFFTKQIDVPVGRARPDHADPRHPDEQCDRDCWRQHHGLRLQRRIQPDVEWWPPVPAAAVDHGGDLVHGNVDAGRRQRHRPQRAGARLRSDSASAPVPELSRINAIRFDGKSIYHGLTLKLERRLASNVAYNVSYTLSHSKDDASSPGATESEANVPQNVRNIFDETGEWALSSFDHRHQFIASGVYQLPFFADSGGVAGARASAGGARTRSSSPRPERRSP